MALTLDDIPAETRKKLGLAKTRTRRFTKEDVRKHALIVLAEIASLTQDQRRQVLTHALLVNKA